MVLFYCLGSMLGVFWVHNFRILGGGKALVGYHIFFPFFDIPSDGWRVVVLFGHSIIANPIISVHILPCSDDYLALPPYWFCAVLMFLACAYCGLLVSRQLFVTNWVLVVMVWDHHEPCFERLIKPRVFSVGQATLQVHGWRRFFNLDYCLVKIAERDNRPL